MAKAYVNLSTRMDLLKDYVNRQEDLMGDLALLTTTDKSDLVSAINELDNDIAGVSGDRIQNSVQSVRVIADSDGSVYTYLDSSLYMSHSTSTLRMYGQPTWGANLQIDGGNINMDKGNINNDEGNMTLTEGTYYSYRALGLNAFFTTDGNYYTNNGDYTSIDGYYYALNGGFIGDLNGDVTGTADDALGWTTGRTITLTGDATGVSAAWDGTANISFATTIDSSSHVHDTRYPQMAAHSTYTAAQVGDILISRSDASGNIQLYMDSSNNYRLQHSVLDTWGFGDDNGGAYTLLNPIMLPNGGNDGQSGSIYIWQDSVGGRTLSFGTSWQFEGGTAPTISSNPYEHDLLAYEIYDSTRIYAKLVQDFS